MNYLKQLPVVMMIMGALGLTFMAKEPQNGQTASSLEQGQHTPAIPDPDIPAPKRHR